MRNAMRTPLQLLMILASLTALPHPAAGANQPLTISMSTRGDSSIEPIVAQRVKVESLIVGGLASTRIDIDFYNPNDKMLEGTFALPLAPGWRMGRFELDIEGKLRAAVPVPKSTGRKAFAAVKRRGEDPALIERIAENAFTARVYPFAPKGHRRVVITLDHTLQPEAGGEVFEMPYTFTHPLKALSVTIRVVERPADNASMEGLDGATMVPGRLESVWRYEKTDARLSGGVKVHLPRLMHQQLISAQDAEGAVYAVYATPMAERQIAARPSAICVVWDASSSAGKADLPKAKRLLEKHLAWIKSCKVTLVAFNVTASQPHAFYVKNGRCDALLRAIDTIEYDGATDLNCVDWSALPGDEVLLFCDGVQTAPRPAAMPKVKGKLQIVNANGTRNAQWLQQAAMARGGQFVDLTEIPADTAAERLYSVTERVAWWQPAGGSRYSHPTPLDERGVWLFGVSAKEVRSVALARQTGEEEMHETAVNSEKGGALWRDADIASLLRRGYVQQEMARLRGRGMDDAAEALARRHGVATDKTSLIVLETAEDYARYAIDPPAELHDKYRALLDRSQRNADSAAKERLESLVKRSDEQSKWWRGEVDRPQTTKEEAPQRPDMIRGRREPLRVRGVASPTADRISAPAEMSLVVHEANAGLGAPDAREAAGLDGETGAAATPPAQALIGSVTMTAWDSHSPYLKVLEYAEKPTLRATYYRLKREYGSIPSFYLDAGGFFEKHGDRVFAFQVLSNLLELELGSIELQRALGQALERLGRLAEAEEIYRKIAAEAAYEPQSLRDLALLCEAQGKLQEAVNLLYRVALGDWEARFNGVDLVCMNELNGLLMRHGAQGLDLTAIDKRLLKLEPVDVRVVLTWSNDATDVDLHVLLPDGEECYYGNRLTATLGKLSNDITQGYGPEEFMHRRGAKGEYIIRARLYADHTQSSIVPKYVRAECYLYYGTPREERHELLFRLSDAKEMVRIGSIQFR